MLRLVPSFHHDQREDAAVLEEGSWLDLPSEAPTIGPVREHATRLINELERALKEENWRPDGKFDPIQFAGSWTLGWVEQRVPARKIYRGYLQPVRNFPIVERVPKLVLAFLTKIPGWNDYVKRENHPGVGWHYHYLIDPRTRSDALLAWDTRWQRSSELASALHPLFGEKHGEGKADAQARPWLWGDKKKKSMYEVCARDLLKWKMDEFRCASALADPVWPTTGSVSPMPSPSVGSGPSPRKNNKRS
jgi:hypothetical protein